MTIGTIYKYPLHPHYNGVMELPKGAKILSAESQNDLIVMYALVDTTAELVERKIKVVPTGLTTDGLYDMYFIGTVKLYEDTLVFHVFAEKL